MPEGYSGRRHNGLALTLVIAAHAAALAALAFYKMEFAPAPDRPMESWNVPVDPPPPVVPPPPLRKIEPSPASAPSDLTAPKPPIPTRTDGPVVVPTPFVPLPFDPGPVGPIASPRGADPVPARPPETLPPPEPRAKPVALKPRGNPANWVTNDDYPAAALRSEEQGRTAFRLTVGADGKPTACTVTSSSGSATLDGAACRLLMRRARFVAGADADGKPVGGSYANSFSWHIPDD